MNEAILTRFPPAPEKGGNLDPYSAQVSWTQLVLRDYVLTELKPDVVVNWLTEPDHLQHAIGAGSPQARDAIRNDDREVGLLLERLRGLGLAEKTNVFVVSDHGFGHGAFGVDVTGEFIKAGLKAGPNSDDVVVASSGQTILLHVRDRNAERISAVVRFLQRQPWAGVLFTAAAPSGERAPTKGREPGTFALELIHMANAARGPDIVLTFPWSSARGPFGVQGTDYTDARATGPLTGTAGNHGSMSPWVVHNTFLAWGPDFKRGVTVRTPASNVDLAPTLLALMNLDKACPIASTAACCAKRLPTAPTRSRCRSRSAPISSRRRTAATAPRSRSRNSRTSATSTRAGGCGERATCGRHRLTDCLPRALAFGSSQGGFA